MAKKRISGLDELMIVNPGASSMERDVRLSQVFLGEDGTLYRLEGLQEEGSPKGSAEFYLGEDGTLYRLESFGPFDEHPLGEAQDELNSYGNYFLGEDGALYQVIRSQKHLQKRQVRRHLCK